MAMGTLMGSHAQLAMTTSRRSQGPLGTVHSSVQSTWQRGSTLPAGGVFAPPASPRCIRRCEPVVVNAISSTPQKEVPRADPVSDRSSGRVSNEESPRDLARRWREIAGEKDWEGLLDPLDLTLREEILRYGEFVQATYDNFDFDEHSKYCGSARYNKAKMFNKVGLFNTGYEVQRYFYATANVENSESIFFRKPLPTHGKESWSTDSNWMGYIAVSTDEEKVKQLGRRDIMIAWRGTIRNSEWAANFKRTLSPAALDKTQRRKKFGPSISVETGFRTLYTSKNPNTRYNKTSARTQGRMELRRLLDLYEGEELSITLCGHSLGSALATLCAFDIAQTGMNIVGDHPDIDDDCDEFTASDCPNSEYKKVIPVSVFSFAGPRVGNDAFRDRLKDLGVKVLRLVNVNDFVPRVPGMFINENMDNSWMEKIIDQFPFTYIHVGTELQLNNLDSPYLDKDRASKPNCHNMEQYLHLIDGHQGKGKPFKLTTGRQLGLVNKSCNFLKVDHCFPECWWQQENKGLVLAEDGKWVQPERKLEDIPKDDMDWN